MSPQKVASLSFKLNEIQEETVSKARELLAKTGRVPTYRELAEALGRGQSNTAGRMCDAFAKQELPDLRPGFEERAQKRLPHPSRRSRNEPPRKEDMLAIGPRETFGELLAEIIRLGSYSQKDLGRMIGLESCSLSNFLVSNERVLLGNADSIIRAVWKHGIQLAEPSTDEEAKP